MPRPFSRSLSRRDLLKLMGTTTGGSLLLAACSTAAPAAPASGNVDAGDANTGTAAETVVLMYNANEISEDEMAQFEESYGYDIEFVETDLTKLYANLAAGTPVDCFRIYGTNTPALALRGIPLDLTEYFNTSEIVPTADLLPVNDLYVADGKRYGMVKDWSPDYSVFANTALWEEAGVSLPDATEPLSYQQWRDLSSSLTKKEGDRTLVFGTDFTPNQHALFFATTTMESTKTMFNEDFTELILRDNPEVYEFVQFWTDWQKEGGLPSVINPGTVGWSGEDWRARQAASVQWGYWFSGMAESDEVPGEDILMMRAPTWGPDYANPCATGAGMMITQATKVPDAAWKLFEWFMGEEPAEARATSGWGVPGLQSMLELMPTDEPWRQHNFDMVQWEMENTVVPVIDYTPYATPDAFIATWAKYEEPMLTGDMTLDEMLANVEREYNEAIQEGIDRAG